MGSNPNHRRSGRIKRPLNRKVTFQGKINGIAVIRQRPRGGRRSSGNIGPASLKLLVAYVPRAHDHPRFVDFYGIAKRSVPTSVRREMDRAITRALQSAK